MLRLQGGSNTIVRFFWGGRLLFIVLVFFFSLFLGGSKTFGKKGHELLEAPSSFAKNKKLNSVWFWRSKHTITYSMSLMVV